MPLLVMRERMRKQNMNFILSQLPRKQNLLGMTNWNVKNLSGKQTTTIQANLPIAFASRDD